MHAGISSKIKATQLGFLIRHRMLRIKCAQKCWAYVS